MKTCRPWLGRAGVLPLVLSVLGFGCATAPTRLPPLPATAPVALLEWESPSAPWRGDSRAFVELLDIDRHKVDEDYGWAYMRDRDLLKYEHGGHIAGDVRVTGIVIPASRHELALRAGTVVTDPRIPLLGYNFRHHEPIRRALLIVLEAQPGHTYVICARGVNGPARVAAWIEDRQTGKVVAGEPPPP